MPCSNILLGNDVLIHVPSGCWWRLLQHVDLVSLPDGRSTTYPMPMALFFDIVIAYEFLYRFLSPPSLVWLLVCCLFKEVYREKESCLTQSYDKSPYTRKPLKAK